MLSKLLFVSLFTILFLALVAVFCISRVEAQVMINEVLPDPQAISDKSEWLELYNYSDMPVDLTGWDIDGKTFAASELNILQPGQLLIVTKEVTAFATEFGTLANLLSLDISLSNSGDTINLSHDGQLIDHFTYGSSTANKSWERRAHDCELIDLNPNNHTLNQLNSNQGKACSTEPEVPPVSPTTLQISELFPSPNTTVGEKEWIELYNYGDSAINLRDWKLSDNTKTMTLAEISISAHSYMLITDLKISLNNDGEEITLSTPAGDSVDKFKYAATDKQQSQIRLFDGTRYNDEIKATLTPTPNALNIYTAEPPKVEPPKSAKQTSSKQATRVNTNSVADSLPVTTFQLPSTQLTEQEVVDQSVSQAIVVIPLSRLTLVLGGLICFGYIYQIGWLRSYLKWWKAG